MRTSDRTRRTQIPTDGNASIGVTPSVLEGAAEGGISGGYKDRGDALWPKVHWLLAWVFEEASMAFRFFFRHYDCMMGTTVYDSGISRKGPPLVTRLSSAVLGEMCTCRPSHYSPHRISSRSDRKVVVFLTSHEVELVVRTT